MTVAPMPPPLAATTVEGALTGLRARGLRASAARRLVVEALFAADGPIGAETIASGLGGRLPSSDLASVYRNLETLEEAGLVRHVHLGHAAGLYALSARDDVEYLLCERCGEVRGVSAGDLAAVRALVRERFGHEARFSHFPLAGRCAACAAGGLTA